MLSRPLASHSPITITLVGRTGVGKSCLANMIANQESFPIGHTLLSETDMVKAITTQWPLAQFTQIQLIDSPGFGDNRPDMTNEVLLTKIIDFLNSLQGGLHIALFCIPAKTRVDAHDINELELLGLLLGQTLFKHIYIVVTQANTLETRARQQVYNNFSKDLFKIFEQHGIPPFSPDKLLFADFDNFEQQFLIPLGKVLPTVTSYKPELAQGIDPNDPESVKRFLADKEFKPILDKFEAMLAEERKKTQESQRLLDRQLAANSKLIQDNLQAQQDFEHKMNTIQKSLNQQIMQNRDLKTYYESEHKNHTKRMQDVEQQLRDLTRQREFLEAQEQRRQAELLALNQRLSQIQAVPQPTQKRHKSCGIF